MVVVPFVVTFNVFELIFVVVALRLVVEAFVTKVCSVSVVVPVERMFVVVELSVVVAELIVVVAELIIVVVAFIELVDTTPLVAYRNPVRFPSKRAASEVVPEIEVVDALITNAV